jgi:hypothetical protein
MHGQTLVDPLSSLWTTDEAAHRRRTLARLAQHGRQLEAWWKCELGAHLWDHADRFGPNTYVWFEAVDRADISIATGIEAKKTLEVDPDGPVCIPIELKTSGTWWGASRRAIAKALDQGGKKCLAEDMRQLRERGRPSKPFGAVGLLVTHVGHASDEVNLAYLAYARELGQRHELKVLLDEEIALPSEDGQRVTARQLFWVTPTASIPVPLERMTTESPARIHAAITEHQRAWMRSKGHTTSSRDWVTVLENNLFEPLAADVREELESADGNELAGKLTAPWSSSALVLNMFHFWRQGDKSQLARVLRRSQISAIRFEACHPTGNRHARANLDVEVQCEREPVIAIESKLREPFTHHAPLVTSYLAKTELWKDLPRCFALARACEQDPEAFQRLDVAQLLKHILGLTRSYGTNFELLYLWYDPTRLLAEHERGPVVQLQAELARFASEVGSEVQFRHVSYQVLFDELRDAKPEYVDYMRTRYFD